jgi:flagellar motor switch protein FliG
LERGVLERLEGRDPEVAEEVRSRLVTFEDLAGLDDRAVQSLLREIDPRDLVLSLRVAGKEVRDRFLSNVSERRRQLLLEELEVMAPVRRRDLEEAQMRVIRRVRELEEAGLVRLPRRGQDDPYV